MKYSSTKFSSPQNPNFYKPYIFSLLSLPLPAPPRNFKKNRNPNPISQALSFSHLSRPNPSPLALHLKLSSLFRDLLLLQGRIGEELEVEVEDCRGRRGRDWRRWRLSSSWSEDPKHDVRGQGMRWEEMDLLVGVVLSWVALLSWLSMTKLLNRWWSVPKEHQVERVKLRRLLGPTIFPRLGNESKAIFQAVWDVPTNSLCRYETVGTDWALLVKYREVDGIRRQEHSNVRKNES